MAVLRIRRRAHTVAEENRADRTRPGADETASQREETDALFVLAELRAIVLEFDGSIRQFKKGPHLILECFPCALVT